MPKRFRSGSGAGSAGTTALMASGGDGRGCFDVRMMLVALLLFLFVVSELFVSHVLPTELHRGDGRPNNYGCLAQGGAFVLLLFAADHLHASAVF